MRLVRTLACLAAVTATPAFAADTIDFNRLHNASGGYTYVYGPYVEDGYTLTAAACQPSSFGNSCFVTPQSFQSIDPAGASIITQYASQTSTLTRSDGGLFSVSSIDAAKYFDYGTYGSTADLLLSYVFADGTRASETRTINTVGRYPVNTLQLNTGPLRSFSFLPTTGSSGSLQFDNIVVNGVSAVPEPASWAMMMLGLGVLGAGARYRRRNTGVAFA